MISLLKCEFKKFKSTYINLLSFLGMMFPLILTTIIFLVGKNDFIRTGYYNWNQFNSYLSMFFIFMVGPILTSFIAVFSVFYEYQQRTMKDLISSPHGRIKIAFTKIIYVCAFVLLQYAVVAVANALCAVLLGFDITLNSALTQITQTMLSGLTTIILVPLMIFVTMIFKGFIPAMVAAVAGTIANVLLLNWEHSYLSPFSIPADIMLILSSGLEMDIVYPVVSAVLYFLLFTVAALVYFKRADQNI